MLGRPLVRRNAAAEGGAAPAQRRAIPPDRQGAQHVLLIACAAGKERLASLVAEWIRGERRLRATTVATTLHRSAKLRLALSPEVVTYLAAQLRGTNSTCSAWETSQALYGLSSARQCSSGRVRELLWALARTAPPTDSDRLTPLGLGNALYGLRRVEPSPEAEELLAALLRIAPADAGEVDWGCVAAGLYGLQCHTGRSGRALLAAVGDLALCRHKAGGPPPTARELAMAAAGLRGRAAAPEGGAGVAALAPHLGSCRGSVTGQTVAMVLAGLGDAPAAPAAALAALVRRCGAALTDPQDVGTALLGFSERLCPEDARVVLDSLAPLVAAAAHRPFDAQGVGNALYGLRQQGPCPEADALLTGLAQRVAGCTQELLPQHVGSALYGLRGLPGGSELRALLAALLPLVAGVTAVLDPFSISNALYGMQIHEQTPETEALLHILAGHIRRSRDTPTPVQLGNALYGLHGLGSTVGTRAVLRALIGFITATEDPLPSRQLGTAYYGLHGQGHYPETEQVALALLPKLFSCPEPFDPQTIANVLFGLRQQGGGRARIKVIIALGQRAADYQGPFSPASIAGALHGLRDCPDNTAARSLLLALVPRVQSCCAPFNAREMGCSLVGLASQGPGHGAAAILRALIPHVARCTDQAGAGELAMAAYGLRGQGDSAVGRQMMSLVIDKIRASPALRGQPVRLALRALLQHGSDEASALLLEINEQLAADAGACS
eukprot:TRINITY_DN23757_c0_g1_i1.p1 TRINITY_DN23757_c0_g1~~TRINITY_DN23757_c0_g1_i1.p1  ORF type:complete len:726 (+),score=171.29 TRINITY_DN23757_c0_g1_i1:63-2240(+)